MLFHWRITGMLVLLMLLAFGAATPVFPPLQDSQINTLRAQAASLRQEAASHRKQAKEWSDQAENRKRMAVEARATAASLKKKGKTADAARYERLAKDDDYEAQQRQ